MTRILVHTAVFGGYDMVLPPLCPEDGVDYALFTDDASVRVRGWRTVAVDTAGLGKRPNRYYKMLAHRHIPGYDVSVHVDGNIRPLGHISELVALFLQTGAALGVYRHPLRSTVAAEIDACIGGRKMVAGHKVQEEWAYYTGEKFPDRSGLIETGVLLKNHAHPDLDAAMQLWWTLFSRYESRDQISLPYVLWKTGLPCAYQPGTFRDPNPYFGLVPHAGTSRSTRAYAYLRARAFDSLVHRWLLSAWHAKWQLQRQVRRLRRGER